MRTIFSFQKLFFTLFIIICSFGFGAAQTDYSISNLNNKVFAQTTITYLDLTRKIFPDARIDEKQNDLAHADNKIELREVIKSNWGTKSEYESMKGELKIELEESLETLYENGKILWIILRADIREDDRCFCGNRVLAAFRVQKNNAELIDAGTVKTDNLTSFADNETTTFSSKPKLLIAPRREAVAIVNETNYALGGSYLSIIEIRQNKFNVVLNEFELWHDYRCGSVFQELARVRLLKTSTNGYRNFEILITDEKGYEGDDDVKIIWRRRFRYVFAWQPRTKTYKPVINPDKNRQAILKKYGGCGSSE